LSALCVLSKSNAEVTARHLPAVLAVAALDEAAGVRWDQLPEDYAASDFFGLL